MSPRGIALRHAWWRLTVVAVLVVIAGCRGAGRTRPSAPGVAVPGADSQRPTVVPGARPDSAARDSIRRDSLARDSAVRAAAELALLTRDSLRKDSVARVTALRDSLARDSVRRDSVSRDSVEKARRKKRTATRECVLDFAESPPETRLLYSRISDSVSNTFIGGGFVGRCQGEQNRLRADSAEQFQQAGVVNLYGNVVYEEIGKMQLTAARATYFTREGRLYADGNVVVTQLATGSTFSGPAIEYYRANEERPFARMIAPQRSTARMIEKDSTGRLQPPVVISANRFEDAGDSLLMAWGDVTIERERIDGRSDSASFDKISQMARLIRGARITNTDTAQRFVLTGDTINLYSTDRQLDRVFALHKATATNEQLVLNAERIDMRLKNQELDEAFAFGEGRARATTPQQDVEADSLRIKLADRQVQEVRAIGRAVAIGTPDTLRMKTTGKDVLRGDSVLAFFDTTTAPADTARPRAGGPTKAGTRTRLREIRALGNASSLFHMANSKGPAAPPGINYVRGVRIYVNFDTGAVRDVRVDSAASGLYLEPASDSLSDSLTTRDSLGRRDTTTRRPRPDTLQQYRVSQAGPGNRAGLRHDGLEGASMLARRRDSTPLPWHAPNTPDRAPAWLDAYYSTFALRRRT